MTNLEINNYIENIQNDNFKKLVKKVIKNDIKKIAIKYFLRCISILREDYAYQFTIEIADRDNVLDIQILENAFSNFIYSKTRLKV